MPEGDKRFKTKSLIEVYLFSILSILGSYAFASTTYHYELPEQEDTLSVEYKDTLAMHFMAVSTIITSNNIETGWASIEKIPQLISGIMYYSPIGFYINIDYNRYFNIEKLSHGVNLDLGYSHYFNDFEFDIDYNKNFFSGDTLLNDYIYSQAIASNISYSWSIFSNSLNASVIIDDNIDYQFSFENSAYFESNSFFTKNDYFTIEPGLSLNFGTENWLVNSDIFEVLLRASVLSRDDFEHKAFSYLGMDIYIPIGYSLGNFSIEGQLMYFIPSKRYLDLGIGNQSAFILSLSYIFDL